MIVHEKWTGEKWSYPLEMELVPNFPSPGPEWEFVEDEHKRLSVRNKSTGEVRVPAPNSQWCIILPELEETVYMPTADLKKRHTGNWRYIRPGDDRDYEFTPEDDDERQTLAEYGFTITENEV